MTTTSPTVINIYVNDTTKVLNFQELISQELAKYPKDISNYQCNIYIEPGRYRVEKYQDINCSVGIYGDKDELTEIYIDYAAFKSLYPADDSYGVTNIFNIQPKDNNKEGDFKITLVNLMFVTDLGCKCGFDSGDADTRLYTPPQEKKYNPNPKVVLRIGNADEVNINNVRMSLKNGMLSNLHIEKSQNINIYDNVFENNNVDVAGSDGKPVGGVLWLINGAQNVNIQRNVFRKNGNDEVLALYDVSLASTAPNNIWKDISIKLNTFEYGDATFRSDPNELFIQIGCTDGKSYSSWSNVQFMYNKIIMDGPVKMALRIGMLTDNTFGQFLVSENLFYRSPLAIYPSSRKIEDTTDIRAYWEKENTGTASNIQIYDNQFVAAHQLYGFWFGHRCVTIQNMNVSFYGNLYDGSKVSRSPNTTVSAFTSCLLFISKGSTYLRVSENKIIGIDNLVYLLPGDVKNETKTSFGALKMEFGQNLISGTPLIDFGNTLYDINSLSLDFRQNQVVNTTSPVLMKYFPSKATVKIVQNLFAKKRGLDNNGVLATNTPTISSLEMTNNTFCGYTKETIKNSIKATSTTNEPNFFTYL